MFQKPSTYFLLIVALFLWSSSCLNAPMSISSNQKFLKILKASIDTSAYYKNASAGSWNPLAYTLSFNHNFAPSSKITGILSLNSFHFQYSSGRLQLNCQTANFSTTSVILHFFTNFSNSVQLLNYQYLIITNPYVNETQQIGLYYAQIYFNRNFTQPNVGAVNLTIANAINQPLSATVFITFYGFDVTSSNSNTFDLSIEAFLINGTMVTFKLSTFSTTTIQRIQRIIQRQGRLLQ